MNFGFFADLLKKGISNGQYGVNALKDMVSMPNTGSIMGGVKNYFGNSENRHNFGSGLLGFGTDMMKGKGFGESLSSGIQGYEKDRQLGIDSEKNKQIMQKLGYDPALFDPKRRYTNDDVKTYMETRKDQRETEESIGNNAYKEAYAKYLESKANQPEEPTEYRANYQKFLDLDYTNGNISPDQYHKQMEYIKNSGYNPEMSIDEYRKLYKLPDVNINERRGGYDETRTINQNINNHRSGGYKNTNNINKHSVVEHVPGKGGEDENLPQEGQIFKNPRTGERIIFRGGKWQKL